MNQFFYDSRGKEKTKDLMEEGMRSQAIRQSRAARSKISNHLPKLALVILVLLGMLGVFLQ